MEITAKPFEALDASKQADGLIPAIIQDARTLRVLMLGYMNREAYEKSLSEGRVTFYSRTRRRLWTKGETSGNYLHVKSIAKDCQRRHAEMPEGSYTSKLFDRGVNKIAQKVGEEAVETVIEAVAGNREAMIYEASDLIYHLLVLLEAAGCSIADLEAELARRHS